MARQPALGRRRPVLAAHPDLRRLPGADPADRRLPGARAHLPAGLRHDRGRARAPCSWTPSTPIGKAGSAGVPHFFTDVRVVRPDRHRVDAGETGEVVVRGPHVMPGYWDCPRRPPRPSPTAGSAPGTPARVDEDGYVYIVDRIKDMIISGGENIYPAEIEDAAPRPPRRRRSARSSACPTTRGARCRRAVVVPRAGTAPDPDEVLRLAARPARQVQDPQVRGHRGRTPAHRLRQAPQVPGCATATAPQLAGGTAHEHHRQRPRRTDEARRQDLGTSDWIEVTQERINTFADATGDHQWIHVDPERAKARAPSARRSRTAT